MSFADLIAKKSGAGSDEFPDAGLPEPGSGTLEAFIQRHGHVTEEYKFYGGEITLRFNVDEHRYYRVADLGNLIPVNGVTNTVGIIDKSMMLTPWAAKMAIQKLLRIMPTEMVEGIIRIKALTFEEFTVIALEAKGAHKEKLDEASDIGHIAHKCLEDSIKFALANDPEKIVRSLINVPTDELAANAAGSGFNWMSAHHVRWIETESKVYSREHDYAGTMDGLATCDSCDDRSCCPVVFKDRLSLIDWKSSNHLKIEYLFQTASYKHAKMEEHPEMKILDTWILRLGKSEEEAGKFEPWHMTPDEYEEDFKGFLACLVLTRLVDSVKERMSSQKKTIRAVKKEQRETAKALAKEQAKLQKALDKATAKIAKEAEKVRIKAEAKAERERLKAEKKTGVTHRVEVDRTVNPALQASIAGSIPAAPTINDDEPLAVTRAVMMKLKDDTDAKMEAIITEMNVSDLLPEGIQPRADDVVYLGGTTCTSTSKPKQENAGPLGSTLQPIETLSSSSNPTTPVPETPQPESTTSTEVLVLSAEPESKVETGISHAASNTEYEFVPPFKLPMEG